VSTVNREGAPKPGSGKSKNTKGRKKKKKKKGKRMEGGDARGKKDERKRRKGGKEGGGEKRRESTKRVNDEASVKIDKRYLCCEWPRGCGNFAIERTW